MKKKFDIDLRLFVLDENQMNNLVTEFYGSVKIKDNMCSFCFEDLVSDELKEKGESLAVQFLMALDGFKRKI